MHVVEIYIMRCLRTLFTRISAAAFIKFFVPQVRRLINGSAYSRVALILKLEATRKNYS